MNQGKALDINRLGLVHFWDIRPLPPNTSVLKEKKCFCFDQQRLLVMFLLDSSKRLTCWARHLLKPVLIAFLAHALSLNLEDWSSSRLDVSWSKNGPKVKNESINSTHNTPLGANSLFSLYNPIDTYYKTRNSINSLSWLSRYPKQRRWCLWLRTHYTTSVSLEHFSTCPLAQGFLSIFFWQVPLR